MSKRLLGIFAHPDDESFGAGGTLARYARSGVEVHVCTVTDGASGSYDEAFLKASSASTLAELRRRELECACQVLGVRLWQLGYRDSGMEGSPDNQHPASLCQAELNDVARDLVRLIRQVRPHVVVTHEPSGGYFHPDHVKVNRATHRAMEVVAEPHTCPSLMNEAHTPWQPARLYYLVVPRSIILWFMFMLILSGRNPRRFGNNRDVDLTKLGVPNNRIHVRLDVRPYLGIKEQASACHRSQGGGAHWPAFLGRRAMSYEHFVRAFPPGARRHPDLFEDLNQLD
jgi:LmbE family N-acetylglucosaminyl deacetylase